MIDIKKKIGVPKYKQIINSIEEAILSGTLRKGDRLPSINNVKKSHKLSRDTVLMAFNELKNRGIVHSVVGKGYYVSSENVTVSQKIFLLFDELNSFKEDLYNAFLENLGPHVQVDIFFHHFNEGVFSKLIHDHAGDYNFYVIMPANLKNTKSYIHILPKEKVYILDQMHEELSVYSAIYQNFEKDIYINLNKALVYIKNYKKLILIFCQKKQPEGMRSGFVMFCEEHQLAYDVVGDLKKKPLEKGELYIVPEDKMLLKIIKEMKHKSLKLKDDIGVISYNDTLLKEIVEGGITTISTDFNAMGKRLAEMILNKEQLKIENTNNLIVRNSL
ncbi:GntR family transcriptional regulator [Mariniflexile ostreae]|uniref:GntR family transcriptional regulator n=1 Tax=Mariniflexile ostreae TaxID=1520892 RepID=A0ABV5FE91_9FLAO